HALALRVIINAAYASCLRFTIEREAY
uniref:Uncharacterized protein n=1 Tax=Amphimedon queenslandica TaxID=400682 RepID=A0A1X7V5Y9_AMPQE